MNIAYAHAAGDPAHAVTWTSLITAWSFDPAFLVPLVLAILYFRGWWVYRLWKSRRLRRWRPVAFVSGLVVIALALLSPIDRLADHSFTWHMAQHDLLMLLGIPLLLLGAPFVPVVRGLPRGFRRRAFIPFAKQRGVRAFLAFVTRPPIALAFFETSILLWHFPAFYDAALSHAGIHYLEHFCFVFAGIAFWWHIVTPYPFPSRLHHLLRVLMLVASAIINTALSAMVAFADQALYGYSLMEGFWGLTMLQDQHIGAGLMWVLGGMMRLGAILIILAIYASQEEAKEPRNLAKLAAHKA